MQSELHAKVHMLHVEYATHCRPNTIFVYVRHHVQHWISVDMLKVFLFLMNILKNLGVQMQHTDLDKIM